MSAQAGLFRYQPGTTVLHRLSVGIKLPLLALFTLGIFASNLFQLTLLSLGIVILCLLACLSLSTLIGALRFLLAYTLLIGAFRLIGQPLVRTVFIIEIRETLVYSWRLLDVLLLGTIFYETSGNLNIRQALTRAQTWLEHLPGLKGRIPDFGFQLSLTILFIPRIFSVWTDLNLAWEARSAHQRLSIKSTWRRFTVLIPALIERLLAMAVDTDRAIRNRNR